MATYQKVVIFALVFGLAIVRGRLEATAQDKGRTATVSGVLKSRIEVKNSKNLIIEILADGDETPRRYGVPYVPAGKGPISEVLPAVQRANIGDRVHCDLLYGAFGYESGFTVTSFRVIRAARARD